MTAIMCVEEPLRIKQKLPVQMAKLQAIEQ